MNLLAEYLHYLLTFSEWLGNAVIFLVVGAGRLVVRAWGIIKNPKKMVRKMVQKRQRKSKNKFVEAIFNRFPPKVQESLAAYRHPKGVVFLLSLAVVVVLLPVAYFGVFKPQEAAAGWWNGAWQYRMGVSITNSGSDLTDFQVSFTLDTATLIADGKLQSNCADIRVTDINGKELPYWVDKGSSSCNTASTQIWTKVASIPDSGGVVYVYYGNNGAASTENGEQVFEFFDDFESGSIQDLKWNNNLIGSSGAVQQVSSSEALSGTYSAESYQTADVGDTVIRRSFGDGQPRVVQYYFYDDTGNNSSALIGGGFGLGSYNIGVLYSNSTYMYRCGGSWTSTGVDRESGWHKIVIEYGGSTGSIYIDDVNVASDISCGNLDWIGFGSYWAAQPGFYFDDFTTRKFTSSNLSTSLDSEETAPGPLAYWKLDEGQGQAANDSSGKGNKGSLGDSSSSEADDPIWVEESRCVSGKCLQFNGSENDHVRSDASVKIPENGTLAVWIKGSTESQVAQNIYPFGFYQFSLLGPSGGVNDTRSGLIVENGGSNYSWNWGAQNLYDGDWHYYVVTWDDANVYLYIDGKQVGDPKAIDGNIPIGESRDIIVGSSWTVSYGPHTGFLDEAKIYPYARSAEEIRADYVSAGSAKGSSAVLGAKDTTFMSNGLIGYWKLDELSGPSFDYSGRGFDLTWGGDAAAGNGKYGGGITQADAGGGLLSVSDTGDPHDVGTSNFSISMWFKLDSLDNPNAPELLDKMVSASTGYHLRVGYNDEIELQAKGTSGNVEVNSANGAIQTDQWYHVVAVYDKEGGHKIYINGEQSGGTGTGDAGNIDNSDALRVGHGFNSFELDGSYDEVRIYKRALSGSEVRELYKWAPAPILEWKMDESQGSTTNDASGYEHNGTISGGQWAEGKYGSALALASSNYSSTPDADDLSTDSFTLNFWYKTSENSSWDRIGKFSNANNSDGSTEYQVRLSSNGSWCLGFNDWNTLYCDNSGQEADSHLNQWQFYSFSYDKNTGKIRLVQNGQKVLLDATNSSLDIIPSAYPFNVRKYPASGTTYVDNVQLYNYARNTQQIVEDMNAGHPTGGSPVSTKLSHWKFDEGYGTTANDSGFGGNSGVITSAIWTNTGRYGKALSFASSGEEYVLAEKNGFSAESGTLSFWVKPNWNGNDGAIHNLVTVGTPGSNGFLFRKHNLNHLNFESYNSTDCTSSVAYCDLDYNGVSDWAAGEWHHLAITWSNTRKEIYVDGNFVASSSNNAFTDPNTDIYIGTRLNYAGADSVIDEVKLYNSVLTADQIRLDINQGSTDVFGATGGDGSGGISSSAGAEYCIPGDNSTCRAPVGEWKLDENSGNTANDTSGNDNTGTISGASWTEGKIGGALSFDGVDDYVSLPSASHPDTNLGSVSTWFKADPSISTGAMLVYVCDSSGTGVCQDGFGGEYEMHLSFDLDHTITFHIEGGVGSDVDVNSASTYNDGQWHYAAATWDSNGVVNLYVDGKKVDSATHNAGSYTPDTVYIGRPDYTSRHFKGIIDYVRIYDYVRTPAQVTWDYNKGGPVAHWRMDECQGATAHDASGNENHGTIVVGGSGSQSSIGTCQSSGTAWGNGASGKINYSLNFDGTDDGVDIDTSNGGDLDPDILSVSAWIKPDDTNSGVRRVYQRGGSTYGIYQNGTQITFYVDTRDDGGEWEGINGSISSGNWHHVVGTYDGSTLSIYVDGKLTNSEPLSGAVDNGSTTAEIGNTGGTDLFVGQIDDVRIYNYALTPYQVRVIQNGGGALNFGP